ncbi:MULTISPECIES: hypothetical protein [Planktothricoides]|uniref:hypothetical protein n=1 Tax=Planktothricoides TaxID=132607 RepID=UPI00092F653C|nr:MULTISPECIES: hypothetical protein [Planktothricoides]
MLLVVGCWLLVDGCWLLVICCWLFVIAVIVRITEVFWIPACAGMTSFFVLHNYDNRYIHSLN